MGRKTVRNRGRVTSEYSLLCMTESMYFNSRSMAAYIKYVKDQPTNIHIVMVETSTMLMLKDY